MAPRALAPPVLLALLVGVVEARLDRLGMARSVQVVDDPRREHGPARHHLQHLTTGPRKPAGAPAHGPRVVHLSIRTNSGFQLGQSPTRNGSIGDARGP